MSESFDVAVIGLGAMGSAALYQLAKRRARVVGIDKFTPPHALGSTHGETRITRRGIGEGEAYVPLAMRSHEIWREIEAETSEQCLFEVGALIISQHDDNAERPARTGFIRTSIAAAQRYGIEHEVLDSSELRHRFPNLTPLDEEIGYFEPGGGYLWPERCVAANLALAERHGATQYLGERVLSIQSSGGGVRIETDQRVILAAQAIVSAGAWAGQLLGAPYDRVLQPKRQVMHWFGLAPDAPTEAWRQSPVFMWPHGSGPDDFFYAFPSQDGVSVKTADEFYGEASDPDAIDRVVPDSDSRRMHAAHLAGRLAGVTPRAVKTATCIYTVTADNAFLIDRHPEHDNILVASPCSGHGFKHSAAIGENLAQWALEGQAGLDLSAFNLARLL